MASGGAHGLIRMKRCFSILYFMEIELPISFIPQILRRAAGLFYGFQIARILAI